MYKNPHSNYEDFYFMVFENLQKPLDICHEICYTIFVRKTEMKLVKEEKKMTKSQERVINMLRRDAEIEASKCHVNGEIKEFTIKENNGFVSVYVVLGAANDEGTLAEVYCREKTLLFIGKRGKITIPIWDEKTHNQRYQRYRSIWLACYDYDHNTTKGSTKR